MTSPRVADRTAGGRRGASRTRRSAASGPGPGRTRAASAARRSTVYGPTSSSMSCQAAWAAMNGSSSETTTRTSSLGIVRRRRTGRPRRRRAPARSPRRAATRWTSRGSRAAARHARTCRMRFPRSCRRRTWIGIECPRTWPHVTDARARGNDPSVPDPGIRWYPSGLVRPQRASRSSGRQRGARQSARRLAGARTIRRSDRRDDRRVGPTLVGRGPRSRSAPRAASGRATGTRAAGRSGRRPRDRRARPPGRRARTGSPARACRRGDVVDHRLRATPATTTSPPYSARAQWTRSQRCRGERAGPAGGGDDRRERRHRASRPRGRWAASGSGAKRYPCATGRAGRSVDLVVGVVAAPAARRTARWSWSPSGAWPTALREERRGSGSSCSSSASPCPA